MQADCPGEFRKPLPVKAPWAQGEISPLAAGFRCRGWEVLAAEALGERVDPLRGSPRGPIRLRSVARKVQKGERDGLGDNGQQPAVYIGEEVTCEVRGA